LGDEPQADLVNVLDVAVEDRPICVLLDRLQAMLSGLRMSAILNSRARVRVQPRLIVSDYFVPPGFVFGFSGPGGLS